MKFEVKEECVTDNFDEQAVDAVIDFKRYNLMTLPPNYIEQRITEEEKAPQPLLILSDGSTVSLESQNLKFSSFVSQEDIDAQYELVSNERPL